MGGGVNDYGGWEWLYEIRIIHYIGVLSIAIFPRGVGGGENHSKTVTMVPRSVSVYSQSSSESASKGTA